MNGRGTLSSQAPVIAGFGVMILLLIGVAAIGVSHVRTLSQQLTAIVAERNLKAELASTMKGLHDARYHAIHLASQLTDPFERDEQTMRFAAQAREFIVARDLFLNLPLDAAELNAWNEVRKHLPMVEATANEVLELIRSDRQEEARARIRDELKPHQIDMMRNWDILVAMQHDNNTRAVAEAKTAHDRAHRLLMGLSGIAVMVAVSVAWFVVRLSRRLENDLFEERERALITLRSIGDAVVRFDRDQQVCFLNPVAESLLGVQVRESEPLPSSQSLHLFERENREDLTQPMLADVLRGGAYVLPGTATLLSGHGIEYEVEGRCSPIHAPDGETIGGVLVLRDVSEARELQRKLLWHSDHDALTGLGNRHAFEERLSQSLGSKRAAQMPMSLILVSLDGLRQVNDAAGHAAGDELLRHLAQLMSSRVRDTDVLARLTHDEFGVLLHSCPDEMTGRIARQISDSVRGYQLHWEGQTYRVDAHIGLVHLTHQSQEECLAAAHRAVQKARELGAGSIYVHQVGPLEAA